MSFLIFNDVDEFNIWQNQVNTALDYPDENIKTQQYTNLLPTANNEIICPIDDKCPSELLENKVQYTYDDIKIYLIDNNL